VLRDIGTLGGNFALAQAVNNRGVVAGMSNEAGGASRAFIWDGVMRPIPGLGSGSSVAGINDRGAIVGMINSGMSYLFDDNTITRLDTLPAVREKGFLLLSPEAINNRGWIVGWAFRAERDTAAFILIPR
jgi:probable HAF family extracellular repeat protein